MDEWIAHNDCRRSFRTFCLCLRNKAFEAPWSEPRHCCCGDDHDPKQVRCRPERSVPCAQPKCASNSDRAIWNIHTVFRTIFIEVVASRPLDGGSRFCEQQRQNDEHHRGGRRPSFGVHIIVEDHCGPSLAKMMTQMTNIASEHFMMSAWPDCLSRRPKIASKSRPICYSRHPPSDAKFPTTTTSDASRSA